MWFQCSTMTLNWTSKSTLMILKVVYSYPISHYIAWFVRWLHIPCFCLFYCETEPIFLRFCNRMFVRMVPMVLFAFYFKFHIQPASSRGLSTSKYGRSQSGRRARLGWAWWSLCFDSPTSCARKRLLSTALHILFCLLVGWYSTLNKSVIIRHATMGSSKVKSTVELWK